MVPEKSCDQQLEPEPVPEKVCREQVVDQKCIEAVRDIPKEVSSKVPNNIICSSDQIANPEFGPNLRILNFSTKLAVCLDFFLRINIHRQKRQI